MVDRPSVVTLLLVGLTGLAILGYTAPHRLTQLFTAQPDERADPAEERADKFDAPPDVDPVNLADAHAIVVVESDSLFTPSGARAMRRVVDVLESLD